MDARCIQVGFKLISVQVCETNHQVGFGVPNSNAIQWTKGIFHPYNELSLLQVGVELVPLLKEKNTGKPRKDPSTGYMLSHSLSSTDITMGPAQTR